MTSTHRIEWRPSYGLFSLRDIDADAGDGTSEAIRQARREVAAATDHEVWVSRAQDLLLVAVEVQVWDGPPDPLPPARWQGPMVFPLECPTGDLFLTDGSETSLTGITASDGPGDYIVEVFHTGRDEAINAYQGIIDEVDRLPIPEQLAYIDEHARRIESYLLRLYPGRPSGRAVAKSD